MSNPRPLSSILRGLIDESATTQAKEPPVSGSGVSVHLAFVGNWHDPCPRLLLLDPSLEPVDIVIWQIIRIHAEAGRLVAFPTYRDLMHWARVSRATVARAVTVLRLARWLPLCVSIRDTQGRFGGNIYALQDEPLPLAETLRTDEHYVRFAEKSRVHRHAHVRRIAGEIGRAIHEVAASDTQNFNTTDLDCHVANRFQRMMTLFERDPFGSPKRDHATYHPAIRVQNLNAVTNERPAKDGVQDLNSATRVQTLNSVSSSKNFNTTTTPKVQLTQRRSSSHSRSVHFPVELALTDSQERVLSLRLDRLSESMRQEVLDEATARILAKRCTTDPVRSEFDYIARLASRAIAGEFLFTDVGQRLREKREGRATVEKRLECARAHSERQRKKEVAAFEARQPTPRTS